MPSLAEFFATWSFNGTALVVLLLAAAGYLVLVARLRRRGHRWPIRLTLTFLALGLGSYAFVNFGFFGTYRYDLRWAFTTRIALLLFAVPLLIGLARPLDLMKAAFTPIQRARLNRIMRSWPLRLISNAIFAPLFALALFMIFVTPLAGPFRASVIAQNAITEFAPLLGLLMLLPINARNHHRTEIFVVAEFMIAFAELMLDAIPGVVLSINNTILDHAPAVMGNLPDWFPTALDDQHFAGNLLWMIAEAADIPILVMLFIRWSKTDKKAAKVVDELSDEEFDALTKAHLHRTHR